MEKSSYFSKSGEIETLLSKRYDRVYSKVRVSTPMSITPELLLSKDNFRVEYLESVEFNNNIIHMEGVFENKSGFYLYLSKKEYSEISFQLMIYYEAEKLEELNFFIKNLIKMKDKNGN
jgi:hypothetical protein